MSEDVGVRSLIEQPDGWFRLKTIRGRLVATYAAMLLVMLLLLWACISALVYARLRAELHSGIEQSLAAIERVVRDDVAKLPQFETNSMVECFRVSQEGRGTLYQSEDWSDKGLDRAVPPGAAIKAWTENSYWTWAPPSGSRYLLDSRFVEGVAGGTIEIVVAFDTGSISRTLTSLAMSLLIVVPAAMIMAVLGGVLMARRVLRPVGTIAESVSSITAENLAARLSIENQTDEFGRLASVVNATLARLESSFEGMRRFTADASHELRTPLTAIQSVGEVALRSHAGDDGQVRETAIRSILEEVDRLTRLVDGLLVLARGDAGAIRLRPEPVDLHRLAAEVVDLVQVLAEDKGQTLAVRPASGNENVTVMADRATLRHALLNLVENAIKYTPSGGDIIVSVDAKTSLPNGPTKPAIHVRDSGAGISDEHRAHIFDRFYRGTANRSSSSADAGTTGAGLGLAIAQWAAHINHATIEVRSEIGRGSTFSLVFDADAQSAARGFATSAAHESSSGRNREGE